MKLTAAHPSPTAHRKVVITSLIVILATLMLAARWIHIDHTGGTYGVSIGTDTRYCSLELNTAANAGGIDAWCQAGG